MDSFQGTRFPDVAVINADPVSGYTRVSVLLNVGDGTPPPAPPGGRSKPRAAAMHNVPGAGLVDLAGDRVAQTATASLPVSPIPATVLPLSGAVRPALEIAHVDWLFAVRGQEERRPTVARLWPAALNRRAEWALELKAVEADAVFQLEEKGVRFIY